MMLGRKLKKTKSLDWDNLKEKTSADLTRKPAGFKATYFSDSAVTVFLEDGSYRTLWYSSTSTCGDLICKLQNRLELKDERENYKLQVKYLSGNIVIESDSQLVSNLNKEAIEKVFLVKSVILPPKRYRKKLVRAFSAEGLMDSAKSESSEMEVLKIRFSASGKVREKKSKQLLNADRIWQSETNLAEPLSFNPGDAGGTTCSSSFFRDSGFSENETGCVVYFPKIRKKSLSIGNLPSSFNRASAPADMRATATSYLVENTRSSYTPPLACSASTTDPVAPVVPKRTSAFLENCTTDDKYLIKLGKHLSGMISNQNTCWSQPICDEVSDVDCTQPNISLHVNPVLSQNNTASFTEARSVPEPVVHNTPCTMKAKASVDVSEQMSNHENRVTSCDVAFCDSDLEIYIPKIVISDMDKECNADIKHTTPLVVGGTIKDSNEQTADISMNK